MLSLRLLCFFLLIAIVSALSGRGSPPQVLQVEHSRSSVAHPLKGLQPITLWCGTDHLKQVPVIERAWFIRGKGNKRIDAKLSADGKNASITIEEPTVNDAGEYTCEMTVRREGKVTYTTHIYVRPVVHQSKAEHMNLHEGDENHLEAEAHQYPEGSSVNLTCPILSHPAPSIQWTKDGKPLELSEKVQLIGSTVRVHSLNENTTGLYSCTALNDFVSGGKAMRQMLIVDRNITLKNPLAWLWPLLLIVAILLVLVLVIVICDWSKKKSRGAQYQTQE